MDINTKIAEELGIRKEQASAAVKLIDEGCTIPFIARYRKEATGALSDEILRNLYAVWCICEIWRTKNRPYWPPLKNREN